MFMSLWHIVKAIPKNRGYTMHTTNCPSTHPAMTPDERIYFQGLGLRIAEARRNADLTQQQLADALTISQPQLASYEVGRRRVPVSMLPKLARLLGTAIEALIGDSNEGNAATPAPAERRTKRGPPSRLEQQLDAIARLPRAKQKFVSSMLDTVLAGQAG
jgi:transcriptional regulator with XRE-family HTH domain